MLELSVEKRARSFAKRFGFRFKHLPREGLIELTTPTGWQMEAKDIKDALHKMRRYRKKMKLK